MERLYIEDISEAEMHISCNVCNHFIEYTIKNGKLAEWKNRGLPIRRQPVLP
jgi:hypothetical protein